jgi:hypothetical protein
VAGIKEKFGCVFPAKWYPRLVGDSVSVLNRNVRRGSTLSPSQLFFGASNGIDVRRDLRASIGEVVLFKSTKRGVASEISVMRSEWGIVVSISFNGTGVLEGYFFESKSYGSRF